MTHTIRKSIKFRTQGIWLFLDLFYLGAFLEVLERNGVENAICPSGVKAYV